MTSPIEQTTEPITDLWQRLHQVRSLHFVAHSKSATGWNGEGTGAVTVTISADPVLVFSEAGLWVSAEGHQLRFKNVFRWTRLTFDTLRLEHLRFGADRPVMLFDLMAIAPNQWRSIEPHLCGSDRYSAKLEVLEPHLCLQWTIVGPHKQERIDYTYAIANNLRKFDFS